MAQNEQMTYKQAIKILSEVKVADLPYNGCRGNQTAWDIARKMAIQALKEKEQAELAENKSAHDLNMKTKCKVGDTLYVLNYDGPTVGIEKTKCSKITKECVRGVGETPKYHVPCGDDGETHWEFFDWDFGVKVFLKKKDAEIAKTP